MKVLDINIGSVSKKPTSIEEETRMLAHHLKESECDMHNIDEIAKMDKSHLTKKSLLNHIDSMKKRYSSESIKRHTFFKKQRFLQDYERFFVSGLKRTWLC